MSTEAQDRSNILNINVGVLGHVDAGKTALVRSLSTSLSTAALDKNPQSQQRGITLDLGFSAFTLPMPAHLLNDLNIGAYDSIQFTLVDCPGHASLIRTIIGGAQIIDMILLVVDANKGIQTQTAECIVIAEITTDNMIIVLNKVDTIPEVERAAKIERVSNRIRKVFAATKFAGIPIVATAAAVGGEKSTGAAAAGAAKTQTASQGIDDLLELIKQKVQLPARDYSAPFYYAIDHCFSIKGHGTVLTGTVLSGTVNTNSTIEIPHLQLQRKVKSLQMFRKPVKSARQGDRVGICVTNLDASLIERSIAAAPGTVPLLQSVLCLVKKVRFFRHACKSMSKFHVSIGHNTVIATAVFFGAKQLSKCTQAKAAVEDVHASSGSTISSGASKDASSDAADSTGADGDTNNTSDKPAGSTATSTASSIGARQGSLSSTYHRSFPSIDFTFYNDGGGGGKGGEETKHFGYEYQEEMVSAEGLAYGTEPMQWALLQFQHPVHCPLGSLLIGSRLDTDTSDHPGNSSNSAAGAAAGASATVSAAQQCRLAFFGPVKAALSSNIDADLPRTGVYSWRTKECEVFLLTDMRKGVCYEAVVWKLVTGGGTVTPFLFMHLETADKRYTGLIVSSYGADGKCRVKFADGVRLAVGEKLLFRYKRYMFDKSKRMDQSGLAELRETEEILPAIPLPASINASQSVPGSPRKMPPVGPADSPRSPARERTSNSSNNPVKIRSGSTGKTRVEETVPVVDAVEATNVNGATKGVAAVSLSTAAVRDKEVSQTPTGSASSVVGASLATHNTLVNAEPATSAAAAPPPPASLPVPISSQFTPYLRPTAAATAPALTPAATPTSVQTSTDAVVASAELARGAAPACPPGFTVRTGTIEITKSETVGHTAQDQAIVKGAFRMEENVKLFVGARVVTAGGQEGQLVGAFGKMGKCKVKFESSGAAVDSTVFVYVPE